MQECSYHKDKDKHKPQNDDDDEDDDDMIVRMISTMSERGLDVSPPPPRMGSDEASMRSKRAGGHAHFGDTTSGGDKDGDVEVFNKHKLGHWETMVADRLGDAYEVVELVVLRHMRLVVSRAIHR